MIDDWNDVEQVASAVLNYLPQQKPFRFVDDLIEIDNDHSVGRYRFLEDEYFYKGHFPGNPVTPGVILVETMAQIGVCSLSLYLMLKEADGKLGPITTLFTEANTEFLKPVFPGQQVTVKAKKIYWRRRKIKCETSMYLDDGTLVAQAELSGMGVIK